MKSNLNEFYVEYVNPTVNDSVWKAFTNHFLDLGYMTIADRKVSQEDLEPPYNRRVAIVTNAPKDMIEALNTVVRSNAKYNRFVRIVEIDEGKKKK